MLGKKWSSISLFSLLLLLYSCNKTNKSALTQGYHDLTAHYNTNWNANDKYRTIIKNIENKPGDDFDSIINLYSYENMATAATYAGDYDAIIKKATTSIQQHEISKWSDNNFLLMGMAHFLKGDYLKAADHFQYISSEYKTGYKTEYVDKDQLKKKAKKERAKKTKLKEKIKEEKNSKDKAALKNELYARPHEKKLGAHPSRSEAIIMLARAYIKNQEFDKANSVLTFIEADKTIPDNYMTKYKLAQAENFIAQRMYDKAISPLKNAIAETKKKKSKARPYYVLAQLYEATNANDSAMTAYQAVLKCNPDYNMEFSAKLKIAELAATGTTSPEAKNMLLKMARDGKNVDMLDQIYYQLGRIYQNENNIPDAIIQFKKSLAKNKSNTKQKGLSFIALADIYYNQEEYRPAKQYYDSTLSVINSKATNFLQIKERSSKLNNIVTQLDIIETEDSLQAIAALSESDRKKRIQDIVFNELKAKEQADEERKKLEGASLVNKTDIADLNSSFYFYNASTRSKGYSAFKKTWGDRKLEDNWRRGEKSFDGFAGTSDGTDSSSSVKAVSFEQKKEIERITNLLPLNADKLKLSNSKMLDAYFLLANAYKDDFNNLGKSIETFETLMTKFPANKYEVECYYNLYLLYAKMNNGAKSASYRDKILRDFADSKFAEVIKDPAAISKVKSKDDEAKDFYNGTYTLFGDKQYDQVISRVNEGVVNFKGNRLEPQFAYLKILSLGYQKKYDDYRMEIDKFISTYPSSPLKDKASELLLYLSDLDKYIKEDSLARLKAKANEVLVTIPKDTTSAVKVADAKKDDAKKDEVKKDDGKKEDGKKETAKDKKAQKLKQHIEDSIAAYTDSMLVVARIDSMVKSGDLMPAGMDLSKFTKEEKAIHRVIIKPINVDLANTDFLNRIKDFDLKTPAFKKLAVSNLLLNASTKLLVVKEFPDEASAMAYYNALMASEDIFKGLNKKQYKVFVITAKNQSTAVGANLWDEAFWFFKNNYFK